MAWTTTPWTLPSNLGCAVNPDFTYLKIEDKEKKKIYIVAECRLKKVLKQNAISQHKVLAKLKGQELVGKRYVPLFDYFKDRGEGAGKCFRIIPGKFVTAGAGTGIVHMAPGFGEEDYKACVEHGLVTPGDVPVPIDDDGKYTEVIKGWAG